MMDRSKDMTPDRILVQTDFDGTITIKDVMVGLNENFSDRNWVEIIERWEKKEITTRKALSQMYSIIRASPDIVRKFIRNEVKVRDGFKEFVEWCQKKGIGIVVISEGLDFVVKETLGTIGVDIKVITNKAIFGDQFMSVEFPETPPICTHDDGDVCGTCKLTHLRNAQADGKFVVYIGDGATDYRPARSADLVFARRALSKRFEDEGLDFIPFEDFFVIKEMLEEML